MTRAACPPNGPDCARPASPRRRAFTLIELLVVIAIIGALIAILLPVYSKVKKASYAVSTKNVLSQLSNAITAYQSSYHAYPGFFSNNDIDAQNYTDGSGYPITASENLAISLCGGAGYNGGETSFPPNGAQTAPPYKVSFDQKSVGLGQLSANPADPRRISPTIETHFAPGSMLSYCVIPAVAPALPTPLQFTDDAAHVAGDSTFPEFQDAYPAPLPILYYRARTGFPAIISNGKKVGPYAAYELSDNAAYTNSMIGNAATSSSMTHGLQDIESSGTPNGSPAPTVTTDFPKNAIIYFADTTNPPIGNAAYSSWTTYNAQNAGNPRAKDAYILISPGPDRIYGTADDIVSFGGSIQDVSP